MLPKNINEVFTQAVKKYGEKEVFWTKRRDTWVGISYKEVLEKICCINNGFVKKGIQPKDRVAILSESRLEWVMSDLALLSCGVIVVPIYTTLSAAQIKFILDDAQAKAICISNQEHLEKILSIISELPNLKIIISFENLQKTIDLPSGIILLTLDELIAIGKSDLQDQSHYINTANAVSPDSLATLIYTSGTTGNPKGVMLSHSNLVSNMLASNERVSCRIDDVALSYLPLAHVFERNTMYNFIYSGVSVYFAESIEKISQNLAEVCPTVMTSVPRIFEKILAKIEEEVRKTGGIKAKLYKWAMNVGKEYAKASNLRKPISLIKKLQNEIAYSFILKKVHNRIGPKIRSFVSGGAALSEEIAYSFAALRLPILQGYGLTETSPVIAANSLDNNRIGTVGTPINGVQVKIADDGEILVCGPNVMKGYWGCEEATNQVIENGWFHTGDIGSFDEDGFLKITDRKKDLLKTSGGEYIAPQPIENKLLVSPLISQAVVIGNQRKFPAALIVPKIETLSEYAKQQGISFETPEELLTNPLVNEYVLNEVSRLTPNLARYEKIKKVALLESELTIGTGELTPTLKVKRHVVNEKYKIVIDKIYEEN